jgi:hypothetical protein
MTPGNQSCLVVSLIPDLFDPFGKPHPLIWRPPKHQWRSLLVTVPLVVGLLTTSGEALSTTGLGVSQVQYQGLPKQLSTAITQFALALQ